MARSVNFQYKYPYSLWNENSKFSVDYDDSKTSLNNNDTYPLTFQKNYPYIVKAKITISATNKSGTSIVNRGWYLYIYTGSWRNIASFTLPNSGTNEDGKAYGEYTWEGNIGYSGVRKFAAVPQASSLGTNTEWTLGIHIEEMWVRETVTTVDLSSGEYIVGLFTNRSGVKTGASAVSVNMDGTITKATKVLVNMGGSLYELPPAYVGTYSTTVPDTMRLYEFTPPTAGQYKIEVARHSGDHEARLYDSSFTQLFPIEQSDSSEGQYFYNGTFDLTAGNVYYISLIHYYNNIDAADSTLFIYKN